MLYKCFSRSCRGIVAGLWITRFWGLNWAPIPMPKSMFFPNSRQKNPNLTEFFFFGSPSLFHIIQIQNILLHIYNSQNNRIQSHLLLYLPFLIGHYGKFNYWNQSSNGNAIHKDDVKFSNFSQNAANFPNSISPGPIPKKMCESPEWINHSPCKPGVVVWLASFFSVLDET